MRGRPPMPRPGHDGPGREWLPRGPRPVSPDRPAPIPPREVPAPRPEISQLNVNDLLSSLVAKGIIPGQGKVDEPEKTRETPVDAKSAVPTASVDSPAQPDPPSQETPSAVEVRLYQFFHFNFVVDVLGHEFIASGRHS